MKNDEITPEANGFAFRERCWSHSVGNGTLSGLSSVNSTHPSI